MTAKLLLVALALVAARDDPLAGRIPGPPVTCIDLDFVTGPQIMDGRTIVYRQNGRRVWRTEPVGACTRLEPLATLVVEVYGRQLCRNDRFRVVTSGTTIPSGYCRMGAFTPYDLPARARTG